MDYGFVRVASATPSLKVADTDYNAGEIIGIVRDAAECGAEVIVFPELSITGYTCSDLFLQSALLSGAKDALKRIVDETADTGTLCFVGMPLAVGNDTYNCAVAFADGKVLGVVPKTNIPNYSEFYELRHFRPFSKAVGTDEIVLLGETVPFGTDILFRSARSRDLCVAAELCEDLWVPEPPSGRHAKAGATVIVNLSASDEVIAKREYRRRLVASQSARLVSAYVYADAGEGESTTDMVFAGHDVIAENGAILSESGMLFEGFVTADVDVEKLMNERRRLNTFCGETSGYRTVAFEGRDVGFQTARKFERLPFVPSDSRDRAERAEQILSLQAAGLKKRLKHTGAKTAVIGISGGLDSALALLVICRAFDSLNRDRKDIVAVTMPGFGTTGRTYNNSLELIKETGATLKIVDISDSVKKHFADIGHDESVRDVTYENSQARERTQILMDLSNEYGGIVVGTGDLSELALGWATYNGDHMSMYAVNSSIPKTLVKHLVRYEAERTGGRLEEILVSVLETDISPELLPPENGKIAQKTEDLVGPYELHDFFLYYAVRWGFGPKKIFRLACNAFEGSYDGEFILKWLKNFYRRFFAQQFKRSCLPDGVKVGSVTLSPRGDFRMPSDAVASLWLKQLDGIEI
ncbi:MAG: NAD(+) synthase [Christensenellales bacterium]